MNKNKRANSYRPFNCLQGNTIVFDGDKHRRLKTIAGDHLDIDTPSGIKRAAFAVHTADSLLRIETELGYCIEATPHQRGLVFSNGQIQEKLFQDSKVGDYVLLKQGTDEELRGFSDVHYLSGMFYGGGDWIDNGLVSFTVKYFNKNKVASSLQRLQCKYSEQGNTVQLVLDEKGRHIIDGINQLACEKSDNASSGYQKASAMPDMLLQSTMDEKDSFIKGLFDSSSGFHVEKLVLFNENKHFLEDVMVILLDFGRYAKLELLSPIEKYMLSTIDSSRLLINFFKEQSMDETDAIPIKITTIVTIDGKQPVYDITEIDGGVFYANGMLECNFHS